MAPKRKIKERFCARTWSPYVCGALLGVCSVACMALLGHRLGAVGAFETAASLVASAFGLSGDSTYFTFFRPPRIDDRFLIYGGMVIGALVGALSSKSFKVRKVPPGQWAERFGSSVAKRWASMFAGCALVAFGAGVAGGCTSGLGASGMMQLAPAGFVFMAGAFAAGVPVALAIYRKKGGRK